MFNVCPVHSLSLSERSAAGRPASRSQATQGLRRFLMVYVWCVCISTEPLTTKKNNSCVVCWDGHHLRPVNKVVLLAPSLTRQGDNGSDKREKAMAVTEADAIKDLTGEEVEDLKETFRTFDKVSLNLTK